MNNPIELIKMMMGKSSPKDIAMNLIGNNMNPMMKNLVSMAERGDKKSVETFARNLFQSSGRNFDKEFNDLMSNFK